MFEIKKPGIYDFVLVLITVIILSALSLISLYGTIISWLNSIQNPSWTSDIEYAQYLMRMNVYAYPFALGLVLVLCMCIPKRFITRKFLLQASLILLIISIALSAVFGLVPGLGFILLVAASMQTMVIIMLLTRTGILIFERDGQMVQLGSGLLHLGFVFFALDLLLVKDYVSHLRLFWISTVLIVLGTILSFYANETIMAINKMLGKDIENKDHDVSDMVETIELETPQHS